MPNITEQLVTLALQPNWDNTPSEAATALQQAMTSTEQALLKEKIICFIFTPAPEKPEQPEQPEPENPEQPEPDKEIKAIQVKLAG